MKTNGRRTEASGKRPSISELADQAWKSLQDVDMAKYWDDREKELEESRRSWNEQDNA